MALIDEQDQSKKHTKELTAKDALKENLMNMMNIKLQKSNESAAKVNLGVLS